MREERFVLGVNYWPRRKAMYWWSDFEPGEVDEDFALIAEYGMNVVRVFLLWDEFQPDPSQVAWDRIADLTRVCDIAVAHGLEIDLTFFTGHMSGPNWVPRWMLDAEAPLPSPDIRQIVSSRQVVDGSYRNMFHDEMVLRASRLLVEAVVTELKDHDAIWMWNLGNEPDLFAHPQNAATGRRWMAAMRDCIKDLDPLHPVTCGLHAGSLLSNNGFRVDQIFAETDVAVMHGYPMYLPWARHDLDPDLVPYLCALVTALCGKPCLAEEWGGPTNPTGAESTVWNWVSYQGHDRSQFMAGEEALADYVGLVLPRLVEVGATGSLLWCFADYAAELWDRPPCDPAGAKHERHFGLVRPDGTIKPHAEEIRRFAATRPTVKVPSPWLTVDPDDYYQDPSANARRLYQTFLAR